MEVMALTPWSYWVVSMELIRDLQELECTGLEFTLLTTANTVWATLTLFQDRMEFPKCSPALSLLEKASHYNRIIN